MIEKNEIIKTSDGNMDTFVVHPDGGSKFPLVVFLMDAPGHPFYLKVKSGIGKKDQIENVENNGVTKGSISWVPEKPGKYYYQCGKHKNMVGVINIR